PVEGADAIARDDDELVVKVVHVTDLAAPARDARYVALKQWRHATIVADEFARGLATRAAVAAQRPAKEPAADGEHHNGCAGQVERKTPVERLDHDPRGDADHEHHRQDEGERPANVPGPGVVEDLARITHQAREEPPEFHQALIFHHPHGG